MLIGTPGLPSEAQFRSIGVIHFDGKGHLTWIEHTVINGTLVLPDGAQASGTYTINPDCSGTTVVNTPNSPVPLNQHIVVVKRGREVHTLLDSSAIASVHEQDRVITAVPVTSPRTGASMRKADPSHELMPAMVGVEGCRTSGASAR